MIVFKRVSWKNLLSTGNVPTEIQLNRTNTTLIIGENGAGKSTILDAICFALFNKGFRDISKPQLLNSINLKNLEVELEFNIGSKEYKIIRGHKPARFEIHLNGKQLNQEADSRDFQRYLEDNILKLNYKSFTQIVILGSASFTPFMQLPPNHRREIIEDLLDIRIFSTMNVLLKEKARELADRIKNLDGDITVQKERVKLQDEYIRTLQGDQQKRAAELQALIDTTTAEIEANSSTVTVLEARITELQTSIADEDTTIDKARKLTDLQRKMTERINKVQTEISFYHDNDNCPTCSQGLPHDLKEQQIHDHTAKIAEIETGMLELTAEIERTQARLDAIHTISTDINGINREVITHNNAIIAGQKYIQKLQTEQGTHTESDANIDEERSRLRALARDVVTLSGEKAALNEEKYYQDIAASLLKDTGIKTKVIRQYLPVINKLVNKYLTAMDFFVHFELDEAFNETIKSRHRDEFSYASFSEGEKQRIDLALVFTWRTIAKMKNSANTNLLLLDEVFDSSLDGTGTEYLMNLLNTLGEDTNVFVISHKGDVLFDKFRSVIRFEKHQNFSRIAGA
jgi:DNA repair exonuclease SbcCD ATPase subunit